MLGVEELERLMEDIESHRVELFFEEDWLEASWERGTRTVLSSVAPVVSGGEVLPPEAVALAESLWGLAGDPNLWSLEGVLAQAWVELFSEDSSRLRTVSSIARVVSMAGASTRSTVALLDLGPGLSALTRTALLAADFLVLPLAVDTFSLLGLRTLGPTLRRWRAQWEQVRESVQELRTDVPEGRMLPAGYIMVQPNMFRGQLSRPHAQVLSRVPSDYAEHVLGRSSAARSVNDDPNCLWLWRNYNSLMSMALDARKPMFDLSRATGAMGSYIHLVDQSRYDFESMALRLVERCGLTKSFPD